MCAYTSIVYDQKVDLNRELEDACVGAHKARAQARWRPWSHPAAPGGRAREQHSSSSSLATSDTTRLSYNLRSCWRRPRSWSWSDRRSRRRCIGTTKER